jgi:hypothetical protein
MILYLKDHKNCTRKFLALINIFRKLAECNITIQKQVYDLFTSSECADKDTRTTNSFTIFSKMPKNKLNERAERHLQ